MDKKRQGRQRGVQFCGESKRVDDTEGSSIFARPRFSFAHACVLVFIGAAVDDVMIILDRDPDLSFRRQHPLRSMYVLVVRPVPPWNYELERRGDLLLSRNSLYPYSPRSSNDTADKQSTGELRRAASRRQLETAGRRGASKRSGSTVVGTRPLDQPPLLQ